MLQVRKVVEHVYEKVMGADSTPAATPNGKNGGSDAEPEDFSSISEEKVELLCQDQVSVMGNFVRKVSICILCKKTQSIFLTSKGY